MQRKFWKMHGIGNDYLYFDCFEEDFPHPEIVAPRLSERRFSVGGDGIILVCPSKIADAKMRMFNADGSEGLMCGNAVRCVAKYLYESGKVKSEDVTVDTESGVKKVRLFARGGKAETALVEMGAPMLSPEKIPVNLTGERVIGQRTLCGG